MRASSGYGEIVTIKDDDWYQDQKVAGQLVGQCLKLSHDKITQAEPGLTGKKLDQYCLDIIEKAKCIPTFKGYKGFPGNICVSVNNQLVHGIPSDDEFQPGDVITVDLGVTHNGAIGDAAMTAIYAGSEAAKDPEHLSIIQACKELLQAGIEAAKPGNRVGCIGAAIFEKSKLYPSFGLVTKYGGHGLDKNTPHSSPFVANKAKHTEGIRLYPGMTIAIEPMLILGKENTYVDEDGWTVCGDGIGAHQEHTIFVSDFDVKILTSYA